MESVMVSTDGYADTHSIALKVIEPMLTARIERILKQVVAEFKAERLSQEQIVALKADYDAARGLLGVLSSAVGGQVNG